MTKLILSYLAGIMDADGYFTIKRNTYSVRVIKDSKNPTYSERVGIKQTTPQVIDMIHRLFGGYRSIQKPNAKKGKPLHSVEIRNQKAHEFVKAIMPYLQIKRRQAEILIELRKHLQKPRGEKTKKMQRSVHGTMIEFTKYSVSAQQIQFREALFFEIRSLNDTRISPAHTPKEWR